MLTDRQKKYLKGLSKVCRQSPVKIFPWDKRSLETAQLVIKNIKRVDPHLEVVLRGSAPLKIAGQKDIDLTSIDTATQFPTHISKLQGALGRPEKINSDSLVWHFTMGGYEVSFYIVDPTKSDQLLRQNHIHDLLSSDPSLLAEYQQLKLSMDGQPYHKYEKTKFEFFTSLLGK